MQAVCNAGIIHPMQLDGKVAFITGAAHGIGQAAVSVFAEAGARIAMADIDEPHGQAVAAAARERGHDVHFIRSDITEPASVAAAIAAAVARFGRLDVLYNNAGGSVPEDGPVTTTSDETLWRTMRVDLFGTWLCCKHGIPEIIKSGGGAVVNTSSVVALVGYRNRAAYSAAKGAVAALTRSMAAEYGRHGVRVNAVAPGATLTGRVAARVADGKIPQNLLDRHLLGLLEPEQIARAALFLASDASAGMTGHIMPVDSGAVIS
jgi:NAD(P)-dependent dehydrogenase (short-subunit alcohol dehydrogenase family)